MTVDLEGLAKVLGAVAAILVALGTIYGIQQANAKAREAKSDAGEAKSDAAVAVTQSQTATTIAQRLESYALQSGVTAELRGIITALGAQMLEMATTNGHLLEQATHALGECEKERLTLTRRVSDLEDRISELRADLREALKMIRNGTHIGAIVAEDLTPDTPGATP